MMHKMIKYDELLTRQEFKEYAINLYAGSINTDGWLGMYNALKGSFDSGEFSHRLRTAINMVGYPYWSFSMDSCRSGVTSIIFNKLH